MLDTILPLARVGILHAEWPPWEEFLVACPGFQMPSNVGSNTTIVTDGIEMSVFLAGSICLDHQQILLRKNMESRVFFHGISTDP